MMLPRLALLLLVLVVLPAQAATLELMTLEEMVQQSTAIVRVRAGPSRTERSGALLYTVTQLEVLEQWKGTAARQLEVSAPGGRLGQLSQQFGGVPRLRPGSSYVAILWQGPSGRVHIIGLSQGLFQVRAEGDGQLLISHNPASDLMLSPISGQPVKAAPLAMPLGNFRDRIRSLVGKER
jgi:hypothetical protein